jgi:hypothetical protein
MRMAVSVIGGDRQSLTVLLSSGDGTFQRQPDLRMPLNTAWIATADINGDGLLDVAAVATQGVGADVISVFLGDGDGTLETSLNREAAA